MPIALVKPEDTANAVLYLASDQARCMTGTSMDVTGGFSPQYTA